MSRSTSQGKGAVAHRYNTVGEHAVDLNIGVLFSGEVGLRNGELFGGFLVRIEPAHVVSTRNKYSVRMRMDVIFTNLPSPRV